MARSGRARSGSTGAANRSFYWQDGHARDGRPERARNRVARIQIGLLTEQLEPVDWRDSAGDRGRPGEISGLGYEEEAGCGLQPTRWNVRPPMFPRSR